MSVHRFCVRNDIKYTLGYGTMLGAVRHKGFIPWDDDIDVIMPRPDYQRFIKEFRDTNHAQFRVRALDTDPSYEHPFAKVENCDTKVVEFAEGAYDIGINIDVFPLDGVPSQSDEFEKHFRSVRFYQRAWVVKNVKSDYRNRRLLRSLMLTGLKCLLCFASRRKLADAIEAKITRYDFDQCETLMIICFEGTRRKHRAKKEWFNSIGEIEFEGEMFKGLNQQDEYLTMQYGDYMQLPPEEDRVTHHNYKAYVLEPSEIEARK